MSKIKLFTACFFSLVILIPTISQTNVNSVYTRYGIGELVYNGLAHNVAMGGISLGIRLPNEINTPNPASFNTQDTTSFLFDAGIVQSFTNTGNGAKSIQSINHFAISFPLSKKCAISANLSPYSLVAYKIKDVSSDPDFGEVSKTHLGDGGLNKATLGVSYGFFDRKLNIGSNVSYIFGSINMERSLSYELLPNELITYYKYISAKGYQLTLGSQYSQKLSDKQSITLGLIFEPSVSPKILEENRVNEIKSDTTYLDTTLQSNSKLKIPSTIGAGISYQNESLTVGLDITHSDWSDSRFWDETFKMNNHTRISLGFQIIPDRNSFRNYLDRINYRAGIYYQDTYWNIKSSDIREMGVTFGMGLPFKNSSSAFNFSILLGKREISNNLSPDEYFGKILLSMKFKETWFYKRRYN